VVKRSPQQSGRACGGGVRATSAGGYRRDEGRGAVEAQPKLMRRAKRVYRKVKMKNLGASFCRMTRDYRSTISRPCRASATEAGRVGMARADQPGCQTYDGSSVVSRSISVVLRRSPWLPVAPGGGCFFLTVVRRVIRIEPPFGGRPRGLAPRTGEQVSAHRHPRFRENPASCSIARPRLSRSTG